MINNNIRTTIVINEDLFRTAQLHVAKNKAKGERDYLSNLINRALVNQLEREGDFEVRDLIEKGEKINAI